MSPFATTVVGCTDEKVLVCVSTDVSKCLCVEEGGFLCGHFFKKNNTPAPASTQAQTVAAGAAGAAAAAWLSLDMKYRRACEADSLFLSTIEATNSSFPPPSYHSWLGPIIGRREEEEERKNQFVGKIGQTINPRRKANHF